MTTIGLSTLRGCSLRIGAYPGFRYDASEGSGLSQTSTPLSNELQPLLFSAQTLVIPPLDWRTTRCLGLPLPPGLRITIETRELAGSINLRSGEVNLHFQALFHFSAGELYRPPALEISTSLVTTTAEGRRHRARGTAMGPDGQAVLVGVARVPPSGDNLLDRFLGLPDEALALLRCRFSGTDGMPFPPAPPPDQSGQAR